MERGSLTRFAWLSIIAASLTIGLKGGAYVLTGSVGLLSDALESLVNLVAALAALLALTIAARPPDDEHQFGHDKVEYFAGGFEGALILIAAASIAVAAVSQLRDPQPIGDVGLGLTVSAVASLINLGTARILLRAGEAYQSITLEADARHLMTDVMTSAGVVLGVGAVAVTGWLWLDPLIALAVAANIVYTGANLVRRAGRGLLDTAVPAAEQVAIRGVLERFTQEGLQFHALRTRQAGARRFVTVHVLVPGAWTVQEGHDVAERVERDLRRVLRNATVTTHVEPVEDPVSWEDATLDRLDTPA